MGNNEPPRSIKNGGKYPADKPNDIKNGKSNIGRKEQLKKRSQKRWIITAFALSFCITAVLSLGSNEVISSLNVLVAIPVLLFFIFIGIVFDTIGLAVAVAEIKPFNSMASRRLKTGKKAVWLITNTEKVSSFCNDLIGDIAGVLSGATGVAIAARLFSGGASIWLTLAMTSLIAAITVGGKAIGKLIAVEYSEQIVMFSAKVLCGFKQ
ncbi:MAG: hypothetical protein CVU97_02785 [Firmicutes bacterium HGW-Firmicutes-21]|nr:MAG: hypothetical protein CVU97_02785 [Firmicutes bacterium HGW-Firmicutes-21]